MDYIKPNLSEEEIHNILDLYPIKKTKVFIKELNAIANRNYHVQGDTFNIVIKVYSHGQSDEDKIKKEIEAVSLFSNSNINVPKYLKGVNGIILQTYKGFNVVTTEYVAGEVFDKLQFTEERMFEVGKITAKVSKIASKIDVKSFKCMSFVEEYTYVNRNLDSEIKSKGYNYDYSIFTNNQDLINNIIKKLDNTLKKQFLHKDIWPWNLIESEKGIYLLDFNDWSIGPSIVEIAIPVLEFSMFKSDMFNFDVAKNILKGYLSETIIDFTSYELWETSLFICFLYFSYNVIQASDIFESEIYLKRIETLLDNQDILKNLL